jgi:hypothetical protein
MYVRLLSKQDAAIYHNHIKVQTKINKIKTNRFSAISEISINKMLINGCTYGLFVDDELVMSQPVRKSINLNQFYLGSIVSSSTKPFNFEGFNMLTATIIYYLESSDIDTVYWSSPARTIVRNATLRESMRKVWKDKGWIIETETVLPPNTLVKKYMQLLYVFWDCEMWIQKAHKIK